MKQSKNIVLALTLAVALGITMESCSQRRENDWSPSYGRNNRGDSIRRYNGQDYYYRNNSWILIPHGYYGSDYRNGYSSPHGGYGNSHFNSSYSSSRSSATSRGGFGSTGHSSVSS